MTAEQKEDILLTDARLTLDVTWDDSETNLKISRIIERAKARLNEQAGTEVDYLADPTAEQLLLDYVRYIWNNSAEDFEVNFKNNLVSFRNRYKVKKFKAEQQT